MDVATFYETVIVTILMVTTLIIIIFTFLYMIFAREETPPTEKPKPKPAT